MTKFTLAAASAAALLLGSFGVGLAAEKSEKMSPGHEMQEHGSVKGQPGASGYAPGHEMKEHGSRDRDDTNMTRERKDVR
jgi:Spy/CpxP family protein refolding chaperone